MSDLQNLNSATTNTFNKGLSKDLSESFNGTDVWTHARNAVNNTVEGQVGYIGNEPANRFCNKTPYTLIGAIYHSEDLWVLFSTDNINSEIGLFDESECTYKKIVNDKCLGFKTTNLITGVSRRDFENHRLVYFDDGLNPSRVLNIDKVPYIPKPKKTSNNDCYVPEYTNRLDCEAIRLAPKIKVPCYSLRKSESTGSLQNGSYQVAIAYAINGIKVTDYFTPSNVQSLFSHENTAGAVEVVIDEMDENFEEFELVLISTVASNAVARKVGYYSTQTKRVLIDRQDDSRPAVGLNLIPLRTPAYDKSDAMFEVNGYLLRNGIYTKPDFNYQPLANKIKTRWVSTEVPADYYAKGGNLVGYMRDEVYSFFIRWVYNTGEKSASYHIPGREAVKKELNTAAGSDAIENKDTKKTAKYWEVYDTSSKSSLQVYDLPGVPGAKVVAEGEMGYHESSERYPDRQPQIWGDLCNKPIRHHKMPDNCTTHIHNQGGTKINVLGVKFLNITHPLDNDGEPIQSIVGYEILRGSREGNKTVIAKGLLNNMGEYDIDPDVTTRKGLYANYPFNDRRVDPFLSKTPVKGGCDGKGYTPMGTFKRDIFTFHSPETQFRDPYLNPYELKIHGELYGTVEGQFSPVYKHPKHKLLRDFALFTAGVVGTAVGLISLKGKKTTSKDSPRAIQLYGTAGAGPLSTVPGQIVLGNLVPGTSGIKGGTTTSVTDVGISSDDLGVSLAAGVFTFSFWFGQATASALETIRLMSPAQQYAYQYNGHGFYSNFICPKENNRRRKVLEAQYVNPYLQEFTTDYRINNLFRSRMIAVKTEFGIQDPETVDDSRVTIGDLGYYDNPTKPFKRTTSAHYASLKIKMQNQYGQLDSVIQVPISSCVNYTTPDKDLFFESSVLFGGDVYINRYTEKNVFCLFNDWMFDLPDGHPFDYLEGVNIPYPRYWMDTREYDINPLIAPFVKTGAAYYTASQLAKFFGANNTVSTIIGAVAGAGMAAVSFSDFKNKVLPNDFHYLDRRKSDCKSGVGNNNIGLSFVVKQGYVYLFVNGVRDFFVESEINLAQRDWGEQISERHYDYSSYTDLKTLFRSDIIKTGNYYKYDFSLSVSKLFNNNLSWGNMTPRGYDPLIADKTFTYYPKKVIYSLPSKDDLKKDNWKVFLASNYVDFNSKVTAVKAVNTSGALILFEKNTPSMFAGVDQLQTKNGIKVTLGDGGLFAGPMQALSNAELVYEYGSCQTKYGVLNTPAGLFWVSQASGRIFQFGSGLKEISRNGMKWWFANYLPSFLLKDFPDFKLYDNPVAGIGTMLTYDNTNDILYVTKKDYKLKDEYKGQLVYAGGNTFKKGRAVIKLGDPEYFEDASFTASYDPKEELWISFHDWHPNFVLPAKTHFMTVVDNKIWKHNDRCDLFCNFYGDDYPFEVEYVSNSGQTVNTLKSIEYQLECYKYEDDCRDRNHLLDFNFDRAVVYNTEQMSGNLKLNLKPKNDPRTLLDYPAISSSGIDILYSKEENKYRFNQFWDVTRNRGEFRDNYKAMWDTQSNGYVREINPSYVNYSKDPLQRKRFRHYMNRVLLKRVKSDDVKMMLRLSNNKTTVSPR